MSTGATRVNSLLRLNVYYAEYKGKKSQKHLHTIK